MDRDAVFKKLKAKADNKVCFDCSTKNPSWASIPYDQLKLMSVGGNGRASAFFKQHGWTDVAGKIESKYTSRAAELYRQVLAKDAAKGEASPILAPEPLQFDEDETLEETLTLPPTTVAPVSAKKPTQVLGARRSGKSGSGLGAKKLTTKTSDDLYDQKPAVPVEAPPTAATMTNSAFPASKRFVYAEDDDGMSSARTGHVAAPSSSSDDLLSELTRNDKKTSKPSKQVYEETDEARRKFANAKSISSSQYFNDPSKSMDADSSGRLEKFANSTSISSADFFDRKDSYEPEVETVGELMSKVSRLASQDLATVKRVAGETGRTLSSLASSMLAELQDRIR